jgi:predicted amidophosphoribosyltransferase
LPFQRVVAIGDYAGALRDAVISAKELAGEPLAMALARQLAERLEAVLRDRPASLIVPIPSQPWRRLRRRTAAPETMAYELSRRLRVPIRGALYCRRLAAKQGTLGLAERAANVRDLFALRRGAAESWDRTARHQRHAILVDDVMTSGATLTEAARLLRRHGIPQITVAVIARAQGH